MTVKQEFQHTVYSSHLGPVHLLTRGEVLLAVSINESDDKFEERCRKFWPYDWRETTAGEDNFIDFLCACLDNFFKHGDALPMDVPADLKGTPFQMKVWEQLRKIPHGSTASYGQIAARVSKPRAARAVGSACHANPIALFIPCHRVVGSNGNLCGYGGGGRGLDLKKKLLDLEE